MPAYQSGTRKRRWNNLEQYIRYRARTSTHKGISDRREMRRIAEDYNISPDDLRGKLKRKGWKREASPSGCVIFWVPPVSHKG